MKRQSTSRSSLFLMEMMVVILFFSLCAAICVHVFVNARETSEASYDLSCAVLAAQNTAECYKAVAGDWKQIAALLEAEPVPAGQLSAELSGVQIAYDRQWQRCDREEAVYQVECTAIDQWHSEIIVDNVIEPGEPIYCLTVWNHEGGNANV